MRGQEFRTSAVRDRLISDQRGHLCKLFAVFLRVKAVENYCELEAATMRDRGTLLAHAKF